MEQSEIDYSHPGSISDIKKRFNRTDYSRSIACPKNSHNKPLPPAKPLLGTATSHQPLIVRTNEQSESSSGVSSNSHFVNPFKTPDQAERHFILTTSQQQEQEMKKKGEKNTVLVNQMTRSRNTSGNGEIVRKSVSDMFDDALKTVTAVNSSSGISMETTSTQPQQSPLESHNNSEPSQSSSMKPSPRANFSSPGHKPSPSQKPSPGQKPVKAKKPTYSGSSKNSSTVRSRANSAQQQTHNTSFLSESSESNRRHYNFNVQRSYLGSLKNDPSIDGLMEFCQATIDGLV